MLTQTKISNGGYKISNGTEHGTQQGLRLTEIKQNLINKMQVQNKNNLGGDSNERTNLIGKRTMQRYDRQAQWRTTEGRRTTLWQYNVGGINLHYPQPKRIDWQRKDWNNYDRDINGDVVSVTGSRIFKYDSYKSDWHRVNLIRRHNGMNAKGKDQGDGIKHIPRKLPPLKFKEVEIKEKEITKIEWQDSDDDEFDDILEEDFGVIKKKKKEKEYSMKDFVKEDYTYAIEDEEIHMLQLCVEKVLIPRKCRKDKKKKQAKQRKNDINYKIEEIGDFSYSEVGVAQSGRSAWRKVVVGNNPHFRAIVNLDSPTDYRKWRGVAYIDSFKGSVDVTWLASECKRENITIHLLTHEEELEISQAMQDEYERDFNMRRTYETMQEQEQQQEQQQEQRQEERSSTNGEQTGSSWSEYFIPQSIKDLRTTITDTANEVRDAAASVSRTITETTGNTKKWKLALDTLVDIRILEQDFKYIFCNEDISILDKVARVYYHLNNIISKVDKAVGVFSVSVPTGNRAQFDLGFLTQVTTTIFNFFSFDNIYLRIFQRYNTLDTFIHKIEGHFGYFFEFLRTIVEWISLLFNTPNILEWYDKKTGCGVKRFVLEVIQLKEKDPSEFMEGEGKEYLRKLSKRGEEIAALAGIGGWRNAMFLRKMCENLESFGNEVSRVQESAYGRVTPFCFCLFGLSQIGKSQVLKSLADAVIPADIPLSKRIYPRGATEHYDGYQGHYAVLVDDWAARADTDFSELLQWVTCQTTVLPMASLDSDTVGRKGQTLQAKLVLLATNTPYPPMDNCMLNSEAVLKRRHMVVEAIRKKNEFGVLTEFKDDYSHLEFKLWRAVDKTCMTPEPITFVELVRIFREKFTRHITIEERLLEKRKNVGRVDEILRQIDNNNNVAQVNMSAYNLMQMGYMSHTLMSEFNQIGTSLTGVINGNNEDGAICKIAQSSLNMFKSFFYLAAIDSAVTTFRQRQPMAEYLAAAFMGAMGLMMSWFARAIASDPIVAEFDVYEAISKTRIPKEDREWICNMMTKRRRLREAYTCAMKGEPGYDLNKLAGTLRALDMLPHWKYMEGEDGVISKSGFRNQFSNDMMSFQKLDETVGESNNRTSDGVKRRANRRAEVQRESERNSPTHNGTEHERGSHITSIASESNTRTSDGIRRKTRKMAEGLLLPLPMENQHFYPKSLGLRYSTFYVDYLKSIGRNDLLELDVYTTWMAKWAEASNATDNSYDLINFINESACAEASADLQCDSVIQLMLTHMVKVSKIRKGQNVMTLNGLNIKGTLILLPYHFFIGDGGMEDDNFDIKIADSFIYDNNAYGTSSTLVIPYSKVNLSVTSNVLDRKDDWCLYDVGKSWVGCRDITNHFIKESDLNFLTEFEAILVTKDPMRVTHSTTARANEITTYSLGAGDRSKISLVRSWAYMANTRSGDCGSPLLVRKASVQRKIVGMHVSAIVGTDRAFAMVITQEKLDKLLEGRAQSCNLPYMDLERETQHIVYNNYLYVGSVPVKQSVLPPTDSNIRESVISNLFEKKKFPAVLNINDERYVGDMDILEKQQDKYTGVRIDIPYTLMDEITDDISAEHTIDPAYPRRVLSDEEMLNGFDTLPRVDPHSSAGYPFGSGWYKKKFELPQLDGKETYLFLDGETWKYRGDHMKEVVDIREVNAKVGQRVKSIWTASLKDETLGWNKIETGNTRLFMNPPMDFTLLLRKYTGAFSSFVFKHNLRLGCAAGFNPESGSWTQLAFELLKVNSVVGALDYTWFDGSLSAQLIFGALRIINNWYSGTLEDEQVRGTLFHEIVFTYIIVRRQVYLKNKGNPSGNALTMVMNNLISKILLRYYWMCLAPVDMQDCTYFRLNTRSFVCGDDNIFAIPAEAMDYMTGPEIIRIAGLLGLTATSERKDKTSVYKKLDETTFLKRGFRVDGIHVKPTLDLKSIENMMIWISNSKFMTPLECTQVNVECAMRYLYFWGPVVYNHYRKVLLKESNTRSLQLPLFTYDFYDRIFNERDELPNAYAQGLTQTSAHDGKNETEGHSINTTHKNKQANMETTKEGQGVGPSITDKVATLEPQPVEKVVDTSVVTEIKDQSNEVRTEEKQGIIFAEQTQGVSVELGRAKYNGTAEEKEWDMKNFFMVPVRVGSGTWSTTQNEMVALKTFTLTDFHNKFSRWKSVIDQYSYYRYRVKLRVELNGTAFHAGQLILAWRPTDVAITGRKQVKSIQHVSLNASYNTVGELETYWFPSVEYLSTHSLTGLGNIGLYVFNKLSAGTGASTSIGYTIYAQLLDVVLSMPRPLTGSAQGLVNVQNITVTGNAPINTTGDSYDLRMNGLDLASNVKDPEKMIRWGISNPFMVHGSPAVDRLSAYPSGVTLATENTFNTEWDEMSIDWIKRLPGYLTTASVSTTNTFGQIIASGPCAPLKRMTGPAVTTDQTPLEYLASHFVNWRGDLEMCVEIVATQYHTGKLFFGVNYTNTPVTNFSASGVDPTTYYGKVIEINNEETCFKIVIPYQHWAPWLDTNPNTGWFDTTQTRDFTDVMVPYIKTGVGAMGYFTLGQWFLAVVNPLVVPPGISTAIDVNIYMRGGENLEFHRPGFNGWINTTWGQADTLGNQKNKVTTNTPSQFVERPRSLRDLMKRAILCDSCTLVPINGTGTEDGIGGYVRYLDMDAMLRDQVPFRGLINAYNAYIGDLRFKIVVDFQGQDNAAAGTVFVGFSNRPQKLLANGGYGSLIAEQFTGFRSTKQVTGINDLIDYNAANSAAFTQYQFGIASSTNGWETSHVITRNCNVLEIEVPYYSILKYGSSSSDSSNYTLASYGYLYYFQPGVSQIGGSTSGARIFTYLYAGDSFRAGQWIGPPKRLNVRSTVLNARYAYLGVPGVTTTATREEDSGADWENV